MKTTSTTAKFQSHLCKVFVTNHPLGTLKLLAFKRKKCESVYIIPSVSFSRCLFWIKDYRIGWYFLSFVYPKSSILDSFSSSTLKIGSVVQTKENICNRFCWISFRFLRSLPFLLQKHSFVCKLHYSNTVFFFRSKRRKISFGEVATGKQEDLLVFYMLCGHFITLHWLQDYRKKINRQESAVNGIQREIHSVDPFDISIHSETAQITHRFSHVPPQISDWMNELVCPVNIGSVAMRLTQRNLFSHWDWLPCIWVFYFSVLFFRQFHF